MHRNALKAYNHKCDVDCGAKNKTSICSMGTVPLYCLESNFSPLEKHQLSTGLQRGQTSWILIRKLLQVPDGSRAQYSSTEDPDGSRIGRGLIGH